MYRGKYRWRQYYTSVLGIADQQRVILPQFSSVQFSRSVRLPAQIFSHLMKQISGLEFMNQGANCVAFCAEMGWSVRDCFALTHKGQFNFQDFASFL